ncbi:uncharacterized protein LOC114260701 [Camellia sinensis]|uniref:uncharacterized protein LOC114260701 n=1 Tax=Camellia sinensis TaxID=4442 RepID=UPI001036E7A1|nr:uncharacterized protein LOC114260701 [Camellia sinensis]
MVKGKRQWLKPGDLRTKKLTEYEKQRNKRIKKNYEEQEMPPGLRLQPHSRPLTPTPEEGMDPPRQEIGTQPLPPHNVQPVHEVTASSSVGKFAKLFIFNLRVGKELGVWFLPLQRPRGLYFISITRAVTMSIALPMAQFLPPHPHPIKGGSR